MELTHFAPLSEGVDLVCYHGGIFEGSILCKHVERTIFDPYADIQLPASPGRAYGNNSCTNLLNKTKHLYARTQ